MLPTYSSLYLGVLQVSMNGHLQVSRNKVVRLSRDALLGRFEQESIGLIVVNAKDPTLAMH